MSKTNTVRVSVVIPVYNEVEHLADCLDAIAAQTVAPYEIIVVDNNSTDGSAALAARYSFVRLINEPRQGVVYARTAAFDAARGDVIGRIDADTLLEPDWVETTQNLFADSTLDAVSGAVSYHDLPWRRFLGWLDLRFRQWIADGMQREVFLFGSNMALRRASWLSVRRHLCNQGGMHEDFDLAIHLHEVGAHVRFDRRLRAAVSLRRFNIALNEYWEYVWLSPKTYSLHQKTSHFRMYPVVVLVVVNYWLIKSLYRIHNWSTMTTLRVNPATFVD